MVNTFAHIKKDTTAMKNRKFLLRTRPTGRVGTDNFKFIEEPLPLLGPGQVLVRNKFISLDPTHRIWFSDVPQYMEPIAIGDVVRSLGFGIVEQSNSQKFKPGDKVTGLVGWQDYSIHKSDQLTPVPTGFDVPDTAWLSILGLTGLTAYFGLLDITHPNPGETLVVSGAAGAVGSVVGQIGLLKGLRVVGIAGSEEKCRWLKQDLGFDTTINYRKADVSAQLRDACPKGVDIYFDNVGGEISEAVWSKMNLFGRVSVCGLISSYNDNTQVPGPSNFALVLMRRLTVRGFIAFDFVHDFPRAIKELYGWVKQGRIKYLEDIVDGLEQAPIAVNKLFDGTNTGKLILRV